MAGDGTENWRPILEGARALTAAGQSPFTRVSVYEWIWRRYPRAEHDRPSLDPVFQGMIGNAPGGPASSAGTPLARLGRGQYVLAADATSSGDESASPAGPAARVPGPARAVFLTEDEVKHGAGGDVPSQSMDGVSHGKESLTMAAVGDRAHHPPITR